MIYRVTIENRIFDFKSLMEAAEFAMQAKDNSVEQVNVSITFVKEDEK